MPQLYIMEAANLFAGSDDPNQSKHLSIETVKIPSLTEKYQEHHGAGAIAGINVPVGVEPFKIEFKLVGTDDQVYGLFGSDTPYREDFTIYGALRDHQGGGVSELRAVVSGRLAKAEADGFKRGDLHMTDYEIDGIMSYSLHVAGNELIFWSYATNTWRVRGVDKYKSINQILRVPSQQN